MAVYHAIGKNLVPQEEVFERRADLARLRDGSQKQVVFRQGKVDSSEVEQNVLALRGGTPRPFEPIGLGRPLTIWITSVYPGDLPPRSGVFGRSRGVLISSAVKSWQTFDMQPRALNILKRESKRREAIPGPAATEEGTAVVFYSPSLIDRSLILTVEMAFDHVDEAFFNTIAGIFKSAQGLPIFASAAPYLLAASELFRLGGEMGNRIFDSRAEYQATENINIDLAGLPPAMAGFVLLTRSTTDESSLKDYYVASTGELLHKQTNAPYGGAVAYTILALDGKSDSSLQNFKATAASAALLQQFYNIRADGRTDADILTDGLKFYNDFRFRREAEAVAKLIKEEESEEEKKRLEERYKALVKNIQSDEFKPKTS